MNKLPTIKDLARLLNVSTSTISRALRDDPSISPKTIKKVKDTAELLGYEPNIKGNLFRTGHTHTIGVILPNLQEFFSDAICGIEDMANLNEYNVLIGQSHDSENKEKAIVETMKKHRVDGLVVSLSKSTQNIDHFDSLMKYNMPIVFFDRVPETDDYCTVSSDIISGMQKAVRHLVSLGHQRIALINGPNNMVSCRERYEGYIKAMSEHQLNIDERLVINSNLSSADNEIAIESLLNSQEIPSAIITFNDFVALDIMKYIRTHYKHLSRKIAFVSFANMPITAYLEHPPIASVEQFAYEQGKEATKILIDHLIKSPTELRSIKKIVKAAELIIH